MARAMNAVADIIFAALDDLGDVSEMYVARIADVAETLLRGALNEILADAELARARAGRRTMQEARAARAKWLHEAEVIRQRLAMNDLEEAAAPLERAAATLGLSLDLHDDDYPLLARRMLVTQEAAAKINADRELGNYETSVIPGRGTADVGFMAVVPTAPVPQPVWQQQSVLGREHSRSMEPPASTATGTPVAADSSPQDLESEAAPSVAHGRTGEPAPNDAAYITQAPAAPSSAEECAELLEKMTVKRQNERRYRSMAMAVSDARAELEKSRYEETGEWTAGIADQVSDAAKLFIALVGDKPLGAISDEDVQEFKARMNYLPRNYDRNPSFRDRCPREIAESYRRSSKKRLKEATATIKFLSKATINKHLAGMGRIFNELKIVNPFQGSGYKKSALPNADEQRVMWTQESLDAFFSSYLYTGCKSEKRRGMAGDCIIQDGLYWAPQIAYRMGLRQQEIAQLPVDAVKVVEGIPVIDITDGGGRRLKGPASKRRVPVPKALIDAGFLTFVEGQKGCREKLLFPELCTGGVDKAGEKLRKRFDHYKSKIVDEEFVFHGLRHTFTTKMMQKDGVSQQLVAKMLGHEVGGVTGNRYFKGFELKALKAAIDAA